MELKNIVTYLCIGLLLIIGAYSILNNQASEGLLWIMIAALFLAINRLVRRPMKAAKARKIVLIVCGSILLIIGVYSLYEGQNLRSLAWFIAGILGINLAFHLKGPDN